MKVFHVSDAVSEDCHWKKNTAIFILLGNRSNVTLAKFAAAEINIFVSSESSNETLACTQEDIGQYP